jgi:N utilization substance protein B
MALQAMYTMDLTGRWEGDLPDLLHEKEQFPSSVDPACRILAGVLEQRRGIDETIEEHAEHWSVSRMNLIDRNILRMAAYELLFCDDIPMKVSINEAIELAKVYGTRESTRFLNGILDRIARTHGAKGRGP